MAKSKKRLNLKNRIDLTIEKAICDLATEGPVRGQVRVSKDLRKQGLVVSAAGVREIWCRSNLEKFKNRLKAVEKKVFKEGGPLTESQIKAIEKRQAEKEAHGEIETEHPGYLGGQDTMYVGTFKGFDRVY